MGLKYLYVPSGYKVGKAYGVVPNSEDADFTVVRPNTADRVDSEGFTETMANNVPLIDYSLGGCPSLLTSSTDTVNGAEGAIDTTSGVIVVNCQGLTDSGANRLFSVRNGLVDRIHLGLSSVSESIIVYFEVNNVQYHSSTIFTGYDNSEMNELKLIYDDTDGLYIRVNGIKYPLEDTAFSFAAAPYQHGLDSDGSGGSRFTGWTKSYAVYGGLEEASNKLTSIEDAFNFAKYTI